MENIHLKGFVGEYELLDQFDRGSFGDIYMGVTAKKKMVAIKVEKSISHQARLEHEYRTYCAIGAAVGIPKILYFHKGDEYNAMVMEMMGPSLEQLFDYCDRFFTTRTVILLANEMLLRVELVHNQGFVHRDIKPDNFVIGRNSDSKVVHLLDFGLAKKCWDHRTKVHLAYRENCCMTGTARYTSLYSHQGIEQSRRDDLISIGYVLVYFMRGSLPWQGIMAANKFQKYERMYEMKSSLSIEQLCCSLPNEFAIYLNYCYGLGFKATPNYDFLRRIFNKLRAGLSLAKEIVYDWQLRKIADDGGIGKRVEAVPIRKDEALSGMPIISQKKK